MNSTVCIEQVVFENLPQGDYVQLHFKVDRMEDLVQRILGYQGVKGFRFKDIFFDTPNYDLLSQHKFLKERVQIEPSVENNSWSMKEFFLNKDRLLIAQEIIAKEDELLNKLGKTATKSLR